MSYHNTKNNNKPVSSMLKRKKYVQKQFLKINKK